MFFDSIEYAVFLAVVLTAYYLLTHKLQNRLLVLASYFFYGFWNWKFLSLILISTALDFTCSLGIHGSTNPKKRRFLLICSIVGNLGMLGFFKYFNFFAESFEEMFQLFGIGVSPFVLDVVLPVGISFYTFQTMSYTIDVYKGKVEPTRSLPDFALYVAFFPQLVAGPIERASHLLPQILSPRKLTMERASEGAWLVFWGLYKKVFIADNLARIVDPIYADLANASALQIFIATYAFAFQIYADFSGYTDIARGTAKLLGFELRLNFRLPYFALDPQDFWRRWHITLSQWLRDYLYIPLGGGRGTRRQVFRNLMITMGLGGLWHGAAWNFVAWGIFHGALLIGYRLAGKEFTRENQPAGWRCVLPILVMFHFTCLGWVLFRIENIADFPIIIHRLFVGWGDLSGTGQDFLRLIGYTALLVVFQVFQYRKDDLMIQWRMPVWARVLLYLLLYFSLTVGGAFDGRAFIYFQF